LNPKLEREIRAFSSVLLLLTLLALAGCAAGGRSIGPPEALNGSAYGAILDAAAPGADAMDTAALVAEALEICAAAEALWQEEGDLEGALATLDQAYELLLQIPDEPEWIQQKDDLRHVIVRQVVDIDRSRFSTTAELNSPIPVEINDYVQREIARFTGPEREFFLSSYQRSGRYRPMIVRKLRQAGLPEELSWLPLVESGFKDRALSRARALGMWQFISSTGTRYGLDRSNWVDERMDPEKSTDAAIEYLTDLHGMFGDWTLALASYNCGENRVARLIRRQENASFDRFWDLYSGLPSETARYVPRFLATLILVSDPGKYGLELPEPDPAAHFEVVEVDRHLLLKDLESALELERETLAVLNPELRRGMTPGESYRLRLPSSVFSAFDEKLAALPSYVPPPELTFARHRVRRGESLSVLAGRYRTTVRAIMQANHLRSQNRIREGQSLKIPQRGGSGALVASRVSAAGGSYVIRRGDTIGRIAAAQNVAIDRLLRVNGLSRSSTIYPGQVIRFPD
jgi:membrane-bound lytic murein transglycosylase D